MPSEEIRSGKVTGELVKEEDRDRARLRVRVASGEIWVDREEADDLVEVVRSARDSWDDL